MALHWYAGRTRPMAEYVTRDSLEAVGVEVLLPCARARPCRPGREDSPLFPGYLFLRYDMEEFGLSRLQQIPQPVRLVSFGGIISQVPDPVIDTLKRQLETLSGTGGLWTRFRVGQRVRVRLGPTENLGHVIEDARSSSTRVRVLLEFLGQLVEAQVAWWEVQPVGHRELEHTWNGRPPRRTRGRGRKIRTSDRLAAAVS